MGELMEMNVIYKKMNEILCERSPEHFMVQLDSETKQLQLVEAITDFLQKHKIRHFGGRDLYLEYCVDGSMAQLKWIFADIISSAVYTNEFEGVIAMDIALLASKVNEAQMTYFLNEIKRVSKNATLIFFVSEVNSRNQDLMIKKIRTVVEGINYFPMKSYSSTEQLQLVMGGK